MRFPLRIGLYEAHGKQQTAMLIAGLGASLAALGFVHTTLAAERGPIDRLATGKQTVQEGGYDRPIGKCGIEGARVLLPIADLNISAACIFASSVQNWLLRAEDSPRPKIPISRGMVRLDNYACIENPYTQPLPNNKAMSLVAYPRRDVDSKKPIVTVDVVPTASLKPQDIVTSTVTPHEYGYNADLLVATGVKPSKLGSTALVLDCRQPV
jgi:hypothetical protein